MTELVDSGADDDFSMATRIIIKFTGQLCFIYMKERVYPENTKVKSY